MHTRQLDACPFGEASQPPGGAVTIHPGATGGQQDRPRRTVVDGSFDGSADSWGQRYEDDLVALAVYAENPVAVLFSEVVDVTACGLEDSQAEESQHGDDCEVADVG